jgi:hypothetical protein
MTSTTSKVGHSGRPRRSRRVEHETQGLRALQPGSVARTGLRSEAPFRDLRRIGFKRRLNVRYLTDAELRDSESMSDAEERYLDSVDELSARSAIEIATGETITLAQFRAEAIAAGQIYDAPTS